MCLRVAVEKLQPSVLGDPTTEKKGVNYVVGSIILLHHLYGLKLSVLELAIVALCLLGIGSVSKFAVLNSTSDSRARRRVNVHPAFTSTG